MAIINDDWVREAAEEIYNEPYPDAHGTEQIAEIIRKHAPFKDVALMRVPRCDECKYWEPKPEFAKPAQGHCNMMYEDIDKTKIWPDYREGINTAADFGCVQWEGK